MTQNEKRKTFIADLTKYMNGGRTKWTPEEIEAQAQRRLTKAAQDPRYPLEPDETALDRAVDLLRSDIEETFAADCDARSRDDGPDDEFEHDDECDHGYADEYMNRLRD